MKISDKGKEFTPCPEHDGPGVCVDVTPLEVRDGQYGPKEQFRVVFETTEVDGNGVPFCVWSKSFTPTLGERSGLRAFLKAWFGRDLTAQELADFDTESLIGKGARLIVVHTVDGDKTYANFIIKPLLTEAPTASGKYIRKAVRDAEKLKKNPGSAAAFKTAEQPKNEAGEPVTRESWMLTKVHMPESASFGAVLGDLDEKFIEALIEKWMPIFNAKPKPTADDKRLAAGLIAAKKAIDEASAPAPESKASAGY